MPSAEAGESAPQTLHTGPIPPGTYRASLSPSRRRYELSPAPVLAQFNLNVVDGEVAEVVLD